MKYQKEQLTKEGYRCSRDKPCKECNGSCCYCREPKYLNPKDDTILRKKMFDGTSLLYLVPLDEITITLSEEEKEVMEKHAEKMHVNFNAAPLAVFFDDKKPGEVVRWFIDHDVCPFFNKDTRLCTIYKDRPERCRTFPQDPKTHWAQNIKQYPTISFEEATGKFK